MTILLRPFVIFFFMLPLSLSFAEEHSNGISVTGTGTVEAKPTIVEMTVSIRGDGALPEDAITKFNGKKRRVKKMVKKLNIKGLSVVEGGLALKNALGMKSIQAIFNGNGAKNINQFQLAIEENMTLRMTGIDKLTNEELINSLVKIIDARLDSGLKVGSTSNLAQLAQLGAGELVIFKITDIDKLKEQAFKKAIDNARKQAEQLAKLSGAKLGKVTSIKYLLPVVSKSKKKSPMESYLSMVLRMQMMGMGQMGQLQPEKPEDKSGNENSFSSPVLEEIPVSVSLNVTFAIE